MNNRSTRPTRPTRIMTLLKTTTATTIILLFGSSSRPIYRPTLGFQITSIPQYATTYHHQRTRSHLNVVGGASKQQHDHFERDVRNLQESARKIRSQADRMDMELTIEKITKLEKRLNKSLDNMKTLLSSSSSQQQEKQNKILQHDVRTLKDHLEELTASKPTPTPTPTDHTAPTAATTDSISTLSKKELMPRIKSYLSLPKSIQNMYTKALKMDSNTTGYPIYDSDVPAIVKAIHQKEKEELKTSSHNDDNGENGEDRRPVTELEIAAAYAGYWRLPQPIRAMIASDIGVVQLQLDDDELSLSAGADIPKVMDELFRRDMIQLGSDGQVYFRLDGGSVETETGGEIKKEGGVVKNGKGTKEYETKFLQLPASMKQRLAQSVKIDDFTTSTTAIVEKLRQEGKIRRGSNGDDIQFALEMSEIVKNGDLLQHESDDDAYMMEMMSPQITRKLKNIPKRSDVDRFYNKVLVGRQNNYFESGGEPKAVPGGYMIWGDDRLLSYDYDGTTSTSSSDDLVAALQEGIHNEGMADRLQVFHIMDPTGRAKTSSNGQTMNHNHYGGPVLFVTGPDITPDWKTALVVKPLVSLLGVMSTVVFVMGILGGKDAMGVMKDFDGFVGDVYSGFWLQNDLLTPLLLSIVLPQLAHEISHQVIAFKDQFKIGFPAIIPSPLTGIQGSITPIKTPPKNRNSLFDFAIAGPLVGMLVSITLLYVGLGKQAFMDPGAQQLLPSVPIEIVKASTLGGGMIEWLLGDGVLRSSDMDAVIHLHPYAVGGFVGIFVNALNLLPIGNTDGGRVSTSLFGRYYARILSEVTIWSLFLCGVSSVDQSHLLACYIVIICFWQSNMEIPCRNEVDGIDKNRLIVAFGSLMLTALALVPLNTV